MLSNEFILVQKFITASERMADAKQRNDTFAQSRRREVVSVRNYRFEGSELSGSAKYDFLIKTRETLRNALGQLMKESGSEEQPYLVLKYRARFLTEQLDEIDKELAQITNAPISNEIRSKSLQIQQGGDEYDHMHARWNGNDLADVPSIPQVVEAVPITYKQRHNTTVIGKILGTEALSKLSRKPNTPQGRPQESSATGAPSSCAQHARSKEKTTDEECDEAGSAGQVEVLPAPHLPKWLPDDFSQECLGCGAPFTIRRRRVRFACCHLTDC